MTFRFEDADTIVGESVIDNSGSTISPKDCPIARARSSASSGELGFSPVTVSSSPSTSGVSLRSGA
jgi:hypothetical protein